VPQPRADPGHPREPGADGTVLSRFFATATTDQGGVRSLDHSHPDAGGCDSRRHKPPDVGGCDSRRDRNEGLRAGGRSGAVAVLRSATGVGPVATRSPPARSAGHSRERVPHAAAVRPGVQGPVVPAAVTGRPAAADSAPPRLRRDPGRRLAARFGSPCPVRGLRRESRIRLCQGAGGQVSGRPPGQWWP
jgi:hypothetical protein